MLIAYAHIPRFAVDREPLAPRVKEETAVRRLQLPGRRYAVEAVLETWRTDDEWWRQRTVSRVYYSLLLEDGQRVTVFRDDARGSWWEQRHQ